MGLWHDIPGNRRECRRTSRASHPTPKSSSLLSPPSSVLYPPPKREAEMPSNQPNSTTPFFMPFTSLFGRNWIGEDRVGMATCIAFSSFPSFFHQDVCGRAPSIFPLFFLWKLHFLLLPRFFPPSLGVEDRGRDRFLRPLSQGKSEMNESSHKKWGFLFRIFVCGKAQKHSFSTEVVGADFSSTTCKFGKVEQFVTRNRRFLFFFHPPPPAGKAKHSFCLLPSLARKTNKKIP